ncbi:hypothetical protein [Gilliamella sp. App6-5]|uniref:hypothetical protein n=1 Tax=Gilliamella sp. App6-5 TaxID=3120232 RepID=UPI0011464A95|nr:hypothetical protein [Gilliamella apicola]
MTLLFLLTSWNLQALVGKNNRGVNNRSDAIILPSAVVNFARPNLIWGTDENAGPSGVWDPSKGFFTQSTHPASYALNFPTTGADGLYFDLDIAGVDASELIWEPVTHEGITATVEWQHITDGWSVWMDGPEEVTRVTLAGPKLNNSWLAELPSYPGLVYKPNLPQTFELVGKDREGNEVVTYGFVLHQWFLARDAEGDGDVSHAEWCNGLGYRLPKVKDLTNAVCLDYDHDPDNDECYGAVGATPSSSGNYYQRQIGAGFFTEWGKMRYYFKAGFSDDGYPVTDPTGDDTFFAVVTFDGSVFRNPSYVIYEGLCVTP